LARVRTFHLGERTKALDAASVEYFDELERRRELPSDDRSGATARVQLAARRVLSAARAFGLAKRNHATHNRVSTARICPGCNLPLDSGTYGRPRKYHSKACYNLARRTRQLP
jgi:hypothetical protein